MDLESTLALIAKQAPALRTAGVSGRVRVGEVEFYLSDPPAPSTTGTDDEAKSNLDPLDDEATYGGSVPVRRERPRRDLGDDDGDSDRP